MSSSPITPQQKAVDSTTRAKALAHTIYDVLIGEGVAGADAQRTSQKALGDFLTQTGATKDAVDSFMQFIDPLLAAFFTVLSTVRHSTTTNMGSTMAELLNEFLGTGLTADDIAPAPVASGQQGDASAPTRARAAALGKAILGQLEK